MTQISNSDLQFLSMVEKTVRENLADEQFGVSELANKMRMSRSNLLRKIKSLTNKSVSQYIREIRLNKGMELLESSEDTISEIAFNVGFGSTSYFIKCFREYYGYPPGQAGRNSELSLEEEKMAAAHRLVAIMFTDIQGYTALMQKDESAAVALIKKHRKVFTDATQKYKGRILQFYGDGSLSTFESAIHAVQCAIEMQREYQTEPVIPVRIGIHSGDVIVNKDGIIGDGVNIASRIESQAVAGGIYISGKVYDEIKNQSSFQTISLGQIKLKNVDRPLDIYAIANPGINTPGNLQKRGISENKQKDEHSKASYFLLKFWKKILGAIIMGSILVFLYQYMNRQSKTSGDLFPLSSQKSIAVLPFINDSSDSSNVYLINGLMESLLNNLQKVDELRVISRTTSEKYRNSIKTIKEIGQELEVTYFVIGSGQKLGDQLLLNIQLIEGNKDKQLWSGQYQKEVKDIFTLQSEIAQEITDRIEVYLQPEVVDQIQKAPTQSPEAYDFFLKGQDLMFEHTLDGLKKAIPYFYRAVEEDKSFAHAYADLGIAYYYLDVFDSNKFYVDSININADLALLYDATLPQAMLAKGLYYLRNEDPGLAIEYLEKAHEAQPNSIFIINTLADIYTNVVPNTVKYLEYALQALSIDLPGEDSVTTSFSFLHIGNAFIQNGFVAEAERYIRKSLEYSPENLFSQYVLAYVLFAKERNLNHTYSRLKEVYKQDSTRLDVLQEVAKIAFYLRDYPTSYKHYREYNSLQEKIGVDFFPSEKVKMAYVYRENGNKEGAQKLMSEFKIFADQDQSLYRAMHQAIYYAYYQQNDKALSYLKEFSEEEDFHYWTILFVKIDPVLEEVLNEEESKKVMDKIEKRFWSKHERIKSRFDKQDLI